MVLLKKIRIAKTAGFCMGVRRAVELALDIVYKKKGPIYTYGPLIHNPQTLSILEEKGVKIIDGISNLPDEGTIIVRAHGISPDEMERIEKKGLFVVDATCPKVKRVQNIIKKGVLDGYFVVIVGDEDHPEVKGLLGYAKGMGKVINSVCSARSLDLPDKVIVVAQTTQNRELYNEICEVIKSKVSSCKIYDTICDSTRNRQKEAKELAKSCDVMIVIGGKNSANTKRLFEISKEEGKDAYHIESESEIKPCMIDGKRSIGVTAGASTPSWLIKNVVDRLEELSEYTGSYPRLLFALRFLQKSDLNVLFGALSLSFLTFFIKGLKLDLFVFVPAFVIFSIHVIVKLLNSSYVSSTHPELINFYKERKRIFLFAFFLSFLSSFFISTYFGKKEVLGLFSIYLLSFFYIVSLIFKKRVLPGSKVFAVSFGWAITTSLLPIFSKDGDVFDEKSLSLFFIIFLLIFTKTLFKDVLSIHQDKILGIETISTVIGEDFSKKLTFILTFLGTIFSIFLSKISKEFLTFSFAFFYLLLLFYFQKKDPFYTGLTFESLLDLSPTIPGLYLLISEIL